MTEALRMGAWARAGGLVGVVAARSGGQVTLFNPGDRAMVQVEAAEVEPITAGAVRVTASVELPLAHGVGEDVLRRWVASLLDPVVRERGTAALAEAGLDPAALLPAVAVDVAPAPSAGALCLCGARTPGTAGQPVACGACGREAVPPVAKS